MLTPDKSYEYQMPTPQQSIPSSSLTSVPEYYADKNVFITGVTGFLGKATIEKLLRSCPKVKGVYCLIRPKKGQPVEERLKDVFKAQLFEKLRSEQPDFETKVHAIQGDVLEDGLGMSEEVKKSLVKIIHIIIHSAATIQIDDHIRMSAEMNSLGVSRMIHFAKA